MSVRIPEKDPYVLLMKDRAMGIAPEMGSALRMSEIIMGLLSPLSDSSLSFLDVGCAAGHYLRSIIKRLPEQKSIQYTGIDVDERMIRTAQTVWENHGLRNLKTDFKNVSVESLQNLSLSTADVVFSSNAFMYFPRPEVALSNMMAKTQKHCVIRSYFCDHTYIIKRAQPSEMHAGLDIPEIDILDDKGEPKRYDLWNIYSQSLMEKLVKKIDPSFHVAWQEDKNPVNSMKAEAETGIQKFLATEVWNGQEIVYPFILPWKYMILSKK